MSDEGLPPRYRRVINATCGVHPGPAGFCNLELVYDGDDVVLRPHASGVCTVLLSKTEARELHAFIGEMLGLGHEKADR